MKNKSLKAIIAVLSAVVLSIGLFIGYNFIPVKRAKADEVSSITSYTSSNIILPVSPINSIGASTWNSWSTLTNNAHDQINTTFKIEKMPASMNESGELTYTLQIGIMDNYINNASQSNYLYYGYNTTLSTYTQLQNMATSKMFLRESNGEIAYFYVNAKNGTASSGNLSNAWNGFFYVQKNFEPANITQIRIGTEKPTVLIPPSINVTIPTTTYTNTFVQYIDNNNYSCIIGLSLNNMRMTQLKTRTYYINLTKDSIYDIAYNDGYNQGESKGYNKGYGEGRNSGYTLGKTEGYNTGFNDGATSDHSFLGLFSAIVDAPIKAFTGLFDFEILGFNIKTLIMSLFTLAVIIVVIKLVLAKG